VENTQSNTIDHEMAFFKRLCTDIAIGKVELPVLPKAALRIKKILDDPECSVDKVVSVISTEPILSASLIRMANSAAFDRRNKVVTDLKTAVTRVGLDIARNTSVSIAIKQMFDPRKAKHLKSHLETLWKHSLKVAAIAYVLAAKTTNINPDEAMLAGLVHDIGKFYILIRSDRNTELFQDEASLQELMQLWHTGVGKVILENWGFSEAMALVADEHEVINHESYMRGANLTDIVVVANLLSYVGESTSPYKGIKFSAVPSFERLGMNTENIMNVLTKSKEQIDSMIQVLH